MNLTENESKENWPIYQCPMCQRYQQIGGRCVHCGFEGVVKKETKTIAEYCQLLGTHEFKKVGETHKVKKVKHYSGCTPKFFGKGEHKLNPFYCYYGDEVFRCIRCGEKKVKMGSVQNYDEPKYDGWGEQPQ